MNLSGGTLPSATGSDWPTAPCHFRFKSYQLDVFVKRSHVQLRALDRISRHHKIFGQIKLPGKLVWTRSPEMLSRNS